MASYSSSIYATYQSVNADTLEDATKIISMYSKKHMILKAVDYAKDTYEVYHKGNHVGFIWKNVEEDHNA